MLTQALTLTTTMALVLVTNPLLTALLVALTAGLVINFVIGRAESQNALSTLGTAKSQKFPSMCTGSC